MRNFKDPIVLVPDTGFHLFFFPVEFASDGFAKKNPAHKAVLVRQANEEFVTSLDEGDRGWKSLRNFCKNAGDVSWFSSEEHRYIRYIPGVSTVDAQNPNEKIQGVWIAIETNLGGNERGWFYEQVPPSPQEAYEFANGGELQSPYIARVANDITGERKVQLQLRGLTLPLTIEWRDMAANTVEVDVVVDFGNSRTCALALERGTGLGLSQSIRPIALRPRFLEEFPSVVRVEDSMVSSRFVLKTPEFRSFDPDLIATKGNRRREPDSESPPAPPAASGRRKRGRSADESCICNEFLSEPVPGGFFRRVFGAAPTEFRLTKVNRRMPHMFAKISPAVLGGDMEDILDGATKLGEEGRRRMEEGELIQQSSAKRYFWDDLPLGISQWSAVPNYGDPLFGAAGLSRLSGLMLRFQPEDGVDWVGQGKEAPNEWPPSSRPLLAPNDPKYPRRNTLTWSILSILETAHRQVNDLSWTKSAGAHQRRVIRNVIATYPSGWTSTEIHNYRLKWQEAIRIFELTHLPESEQRLELVMNMDEAVASQLPMIYSAMERMSGRVVGENWTAVHGRRSGAPEHNGRPCVRVMNIDIGGGTSDVSVVEYVDNREGMQVDLRADVLFKDSSTAAGDVLVKSIIERIILPRLAAKEADPLVYAKYFAAEENTTRTAKRVGLLTSVLVPMAIKILQERCSGSWSEGSLNRSLSEWVGQQSSQLRLLFKELGLGAKSEDTTYLEVDAESLDRLIEEVFGRFARTLAKHAAVFDVDLLMVCGKPSEQPALVNLLTRLVPIPLDRIVFTKGYKAGNWYPFREGIEGQVADAKSVTCVGAALEHAMTAGVVPGWKIKVTNRSAYRNVWGQMPKSGPRFSVRIMDEPDDRSAELVLPVGARIGRKMFDTHAAYPEPVYQLACTDGSRPSGDVSVTFARIVPEADGLSPGALSDGLRLDRVVDPDTGEDLTGSFRLRLFPVGESDTNWQDSGILNTQYSQK